MLTMKLTVRNLTYLAWLQAIVAMLGSLYFSEIRHLVPCVLCWYQRILMYPLVIVIGVGLLRGDKKQLPSYVLPFSVTGIGVALFHWLLQMGVLPDKIAPCQAGISCTTRYVEYFGFVTIPFLSLVAFSIVTTLMLMVAKSPKESHDR